MEFFNLICRFAAVDGTINASEGKVFLDIFKTLHPKQYAGISADDAVTLLDRHLHKHPENFRPPVPIPLLLTLAQRAGGSLAVKLGKLMYKVAMQVALADGPLSSLEKGELEAFRNATMTSEQESETAGMEEVNEGLFSNPSPSIASVSLPFESLLQRTTELVVELEKLLKVELRKTRQSSMARDLLEQDISMVIVRFGFADGMISKNASNLYLQLFKRLHPRTYAGWTVDSASAFLRRLTENNRDNYLGPLRKPYTFGFVESFDAVNGTDFVNQARDLVLAIAIFAAAVNGSVSDEKTAEITQLKAVLE